MLNYRWRVLQQGRLPLRPDGSMDRTNGHRCTSMLLWPEGEEPGPDNTLVTDPCFNQAGLATAAAALRGLQISWNDLGRGFSTHDHHDHVSSLKDQVQSQLRQFQPQPGGPLSGLQLVTLPGHDAEQQAVVFSDGGGEVWVVGDAVLDQEWLLAWAYYWPNRYGPEEVAETWRSVARVIAGADLVVPGHGPPFRITTTLLEVLLEGFQRAPFAELCPEVAGMIQGRLAEESVA